MPCRHRRAIIHGLDVIAGEYGRVVRCDIEMRMPRRKRTSWHGQQRGLILSRVRLLIHQGTVCQASTTF